jgi:hypothetical protein
MAEDITRPETLQGIDEDAEGTGIYWFVDRTGRFEQAFVPSITRRRAIELAEDFDVWARFIPPPPRNRLDAYRWVPNSVDDLASLTSSRCSGDCRRDLDCVNNACRCINGQCRRK